MVFVAVLRGSSVAALGNSRLIALDQANVAWAWALVASYVCGFCGMPWLFRRLDGRRVGAP